MQRTCTGKTQC